MDELFFCFEVRQPKSLLDQFIIDDYICAHWNTPHHTHYYMHDLMSTNNCFGEAYFMNSDLSCLYTTNRTHQNSQLSHSEFGGSVMRGRISTFGIPEIGKVLNFPVSL